METEKKYKYDLEERLIEFSSSVIDIAERIGHSTTAFIISKQLIRSGISPSLNYGEAQGAESREDFIHKMKICLKELRETFVCLKIILKRKLLKDGSILDGVLKENNELIAIFVKSIETAQKSLIKR
jgi:four helix bundle protein